MPQLNCAATLLCALKRLARNTTVLLFTLLLCAAIGSAAAELRGRVLDAAGLPIPGAQVTARTDSVAFTTRTDPAGSYSFTSLPAVNVSVRATAEGFRSAEQRLTLTPAGQSLDIPLAVAGRLEGVVVTATRNDLESTASVLPTAVVSQQRFNELMPSNLAQALTEVPGVMWVNAGAFRSRPVIRGLASNRILVLVDGERLNNGRTSTDDAGIETSLVDFSQLDQVEVVKGPGSVLYGSDAFGGVLNLRTVTPSASEGVSWAAKLRSDFDSATSSFRPSADLYLGLPKISFRATGSLSDIGDYKSPIGRVFGTGVDENGGAGEVRFYPSSGHQTFVKFLYRGAYDFGLPSLDPNPVFLASFPFSKLRKLSAGYSGSFNSLALSSLNVRVFQQSQRRDFSNLLRSPGFSLFSDTVTDVDTIGLDVQATSVLRQHLLTYGVNSYRDKNRDARVQIMNPGLPSEMVLSRAPSVPNSSLMGVGIFLQDQYQPFSRLRLVGGIRFDRFRLDASETPNFDPQAGTLISQQRTDQAVSGNIGGKFEVVTGWSFTGNVARAFREPNLFDRYFFGRGSVGGFIVPNPNLDPETSLQFDLGTRFEREGARLSLNYFQNRIDGLITSAPGTFLGSPVVGGQPVRQNVNVGRARIRGVEAGLETDLRLGTAMFTPFVNLAWQRGDNLTNDQPLPLIAPFAASSGLRWRSNRLNTWAEAGSYVANGTDRVPPGFGPLVGFATFAFRGGHEVSRETPLGSWLPSGIKSASLNFAVENLADRNYRGLFESVPEPGRTLRVGIALNLGKGQ